MELIGRVTKRLFRPILPKDRTQQQKDKNEMKPSRIGHKTMLLFLLMYLVLFVQSEAEIIFEDVPEPGFWMEGNSGPWGPGNPFYETQTPLRKRLISYLNSHPSTIPQLESVFSGHAENIAQDIAALSDAQMIREIDMREGKAVYAPTFAILSRSDLELLGPLMLQAAEAYGEKIDQNRDELDKILARAGLDTQYRLPVFLAFIRDKIFYEYMEEKRLFPTEDGLCPKNGKGNLYGVEAYEPLSSRQPYGITHCMKNEWSYLFVHPYFGSDSLFETWGFKNLWEAKGAFSKIMETVRRKRPVKESTIVNKFRGKQVEKHIPAILVYLVQQQALAESEDGYINTSARLDKSTMKALKEVSAQATAGMAEFIGGVELAQLHEKTSPGRNGISIAEFREAVAWQTIWATAGFLREKGFFPELSESGRELFVFER